MKLRLAAAVVTGLFLYIGARGAGPVPALGSFLDPGGGIWAVASHAKLPARASAAIPELGDSVSVLYDSRGVPHIFATTTQDAVRALGFVVARDRLFQLEIQTRATAGTLTELVGPAALSADRQARSYGLALSAERAWSATDSAGRAMVQAFADGVNAYLDRMTPGELPAEYRLLGKQPMRWRPEYSVYMHRRMGLTLAYNREELAREDAVRLVGERAADALFPMHSPIVEPVVPGGRRYPAFDTSPLPPPSPARVAAGASAERSSVECDELCGALGLGGERAADAIGSNSWAVAPGRSASGRALLAGDPHLELSLPSIWYEMHLVVPSEGLDVYGVTIPGAPSVIIGFNRDVAWTFTNAQIDVVDHYRELVDDVQRPTRYQLDGEWRPLEQRVETYLDARGAVLAVDTIYQTHRGPVVWRAGTPYSMRWTLLESHGGWEAFAGAMTARTVDEWLRAMTAFEAPAQNGLVADRAGNIAVQTAGWYPVRPGDGRGDYVRDGTTSASDWTGRMAAASWPMARNPAQGFIATANQQHFDPASVPGYFGAHWPTPWRAMRINALLRADSSVTPDGMRRFQTDPGNERERLFRPAFLEAAQRERAAGRGGEALARAAQLLGDWDGRHTPDNRRAVLFELAMEQLGNRTWDELVDPATSRRVWTPSEGVLYRLLHDPRSPWWNVRSTPAMEDRDAILSASLVAALAQAEERYGDPAGDGWRWDRIRTANIYHLLRLPSFSALEVPAQGASGALNPVSGRGTFGASWRMVVEMGDTLRAWVTYPGGQSGNPASAWYSDRVSQWSAGDLTEAIVPHSIGDLDPHLVAARLTLSPGAR